MDDVDAIVAAGAHCDVRGSFTPAVTMLELAVDALHSHTPIRTCCSTTACASAYLPEIQFQGQIVHRNSQYALYATACLRGGLQPDLLRNAGWWNSRLRTYATSGLIIYTRAAAERRKTTSEKAATSSPSAGEGQQLREKATTVARRRNGASPRRGTNSPRRRLGSRRHNETCTTARRDRATLHRCASLGQSGPCFFCSRLRRAKGATVSTAPCQQTGVPRSS